MISDQVNLPKDTITSLNFSNIHQDILISTSWDSVIYLHIHNFILIDSAYMYTRLIISLEIAYLIKYNLNTLNLTVFSIKMTTATFIQSD
jgi:hypothetical protein